jgi:hypothetical protein
VKKPVHKPVIAHQAPTAAAKPAPARAAAKPAPAPAAAKPAPARQSTDSPDSPPTKKPLVRPGWRDPFNE